MENTLFLYLSCIYLYMGMYRFSKFLKIKNWSPSPQSFPDRYCQDVDHWMKCLWDHSFSAFAKYFEKLTFLTPRFSEYFLNVLNEWYLWLLLNTYVKKGNAWQAGGLSSVLSPCNMIATT